MLPLRLCSHDDEAPKLCSLVPTAKKNAFMGGADSAPLGQLARAH
jgi:hypothetical protein